MTHSLKAATAKTNSTYYTRAVAEEIALLELYIFVASDGGAVSATLSSTSTITINGTTITGSQMTVSTAYYNAWKGDVVDFAKSAELAVVIKHFEDLGYVISRKSSNGTTLYWEVVWA